MLESGPSHTITYAHKYHVRPCVSVHTHAYTLHSSTYIAMNMCIDDGYVPTSVCMGSINSYVPICVCTKICVSMCPCLYVDLYVCVCFCVCLYTTLLCRCVYTQV